MTISIVIPNYNGKELLQKNLPKIFIELKKFDSGKTEIIVADDASTDDSVAFLNGLKERDLKVLVNEKNLGFSPTVNKGVKIASGEVIVLLNTDIYPEEGFLEPLLSHFKDEKVFAVGCLDKSMEEGKIVLRGRGLGVWKRGFLVHRRGEVNKADTLWASGGSSAFKKTIWESLGGLNELFAPFYWEDIDISYRALKSGYKVIFEPKSIVIHEHEKGAIKGKYSPSQIKVIAYKNQFIFVWENADADLIISHVLWLPYHLVKALIRFDWQFFLGLFSAFLVVPKALRFRHKAQALFIKKDKEVVKEFI
jgi:GT2 family glycosyltransferase